MSSDAQKSLTLFSYPRWVLWLSAAFILAGLALGLSWISSRYQSILGWGPFLGALILGCGILYAGWRLVKISEPGPLPRWLGGLLVGAAVLRLVMGAVWFIALPILGHGSPTELAGYVMADAHERDLQAWKLAQSNKPLQQAFFNYRKADQYGGMLFLSALFYRYLGGNTHQPLAMMVVAAAFSALAVLFTWAFARRAWNDRVGRLAAWGLAIYPEAVLLGSSQMREAFTIPLAAAAFYGLARFRQTRAWMSLLWVLVALLLYLPFSPPFAALLLAMLILVGLTMGGNPLKGLQRDRRRLWLVLGAVLLVILVGVGVWLALQQSAPQKASNPMALVSWWVRKSAEYQAYISKRASGWVQKVFRMTPTWFHTPFLLAYGVVQPFLPAALVVRSEAPIWPWITLWRSIGWTILLVLLLYAPLRAWRKNDADSFTRALILVAWLGILVASFRGGGDQSDNPRYRAAFASLQVALAAWAWVAQRRATDPWWRRALVGVALILAWFLPWYLRREIHLLWPVADLFKTLGLGFASAALYIVWDWARTAGKREISVHEA